jgi:hypothetical protein
VPIVDHMSSRGVLRIVIGLVVVLACVSPPAQASTILDFQGLAAGGGTIAFSGGAAPLVGTNIPIVTLGGIETPLNAGNYDVTNGYLNFQTGNLISYSGGSYNFGNGGFFTITGGVTAAGISATTGAPPTPTVLLTGSFLGAQVGSGVVSFVLGNGPDTKNPDLLTYFGLSTATQFQFDAKTNLNVSSGALNGGSFSGTAFSTDISNTVVPEPGSMMLFGTGLVGLSALVRRRKQTSQSEN